jgi:CBS domain-containing protein
VDGWGIVTDRDLRSKVLAAGLDPASPVSSIASVPARSVGEDTLASEALLRMFAEGVHHFPVLGEGGRIVGVVTESDLTDVGQHGPIALRGRIDRARSSGEVSDAGRELPSVVVALVDASADPVDVGRVVALLVDAMTERLIELAIEDLGEPPAPWAWLALGSAARQEQALRTDQDHALAYDAVEGATDDIDPYFAALASSVTDGLEAAGIARCPGDVMATHPSLRRSLSSWAEAMHTWMQDLSPRGSELSSLVYDYRRVAGPLDAEPFLDDVVRDARTRPGFLRALGRRALELRPPTGFLRDLVVERHGEHAGRLDVKRGGITIVGNLARVQAVSSGVTAKGTVERLRTDKRGPLSALVADELTEAFHFLWEIRLRHQVDQVHTGEAPDDFVDPSTLGPVARRGLRESFRVIARAQRELATAMDLRMP